VRRIAAAGQILFCGKGCETISCRTAGDAGKISSMITKLFTHKDNPSGSERAIPGKAAPVPRPLIELHDVVKAYVTPVGNFIALDGVSLQVREGEFVAVVGKSGSGKSTLINMITGIDKPTSGSVYVGNVPVHTLKEGPMAEWRGRNVGVIFQFFQLLPMLSCLENVMLPMDFCDMYSGRERKERALYLLELVDMVEHAYKLPFEVSGGQQQRVAIARAMANDPPILAADEPTGNLDSKTADDVFAVFEELVAQGKTILMVTHDRDLARRVSRTIALADGIIVNGANAEGMIVRGANANRITVNDEEVGEAD